MTRTPLGLTAAGVGPLFFAVIGIFAMNLPAFAQSIEPKEPAIVLPPVLLRIQDVSKPKIDTPLPKGSGPALPPVSVALPKAAGMPTSGGDLAVPLPVASGAAGAPGRPSSFFSEGDIGFGSMNHVLGDITLYKLGADPRFSIHFSHDQLDGYGFRPAGSGFFNRTDAIDGSLSSSSEGVYSLDAGAGFSDRTDGLQQLSSAYNSVEHSFVAGHLSGDYLRLSPFSLGASLEASNTAMNVSGPTPLNGSELEIEPSIHSSVQLSGVRIGLSGFYGLGQTVALAAGSSGGSTTQLQRAGGTLSVKAELPLSLTLDGSVGLHWDDYNDLVVPFSVALRGDWGDVLSLDLHGGQRVRDLSYAGVWHDLPFLTEGGALHPTIEWYGGASTQLHLSRSFALDGGVEYTTDTAAIIPQAIDPGTGLFTFSQLPYVSLAPSAGLSWTPVEAFSLRLGWKGSFLGTSPFFPTTVLSLDAEVADPSTRYGGGLTGKWEIFPDGTQLPVVGLSGFWRVGEGVMFTLTGEDLLSPLIPGGRTLWGGIEAGFPGYYQPGIGVTFATHISL